MRIEDAFAVAGRGMVVTGILDGKVTAGDWADIKTVSGEKLETMQVIGIEHYHQLFDSLEGDLSRPCGVGLLLRDGLSKDRDWYIGKTISLV